MKFYKNKDILVTGGAGSIGKNVVKALLKYNPKRIRILDQNETALFYLQQSLNKHKNVRYLLGDITKEERVKYATKDVDIVIHCAALKHVPSCEYNPFEAIETNVLGIKNIINACRENNVKKCVYISTDKAVNPSNIMGMTKLIGEKLINSASVGKTSTKFSTVRFGNVLNSNGSVIPLFKSQIKIGGPITLTDPNMTRFFMSISNAVNLVLEVVAETKGRETFILKMNSMKIKDLAEVLVNSLSKEKINIKIVGKRPGEKLYEALLTKEESVIAKNNKDKFILKQELWTPHFITKNKRFGKTINSEEYDSRYSKHLSKKQIYSLLKQEKII